MSDQDPVVHIVDELRPMVEHLDASYRDLVGHEFARNGLDDPDLAEAVYAALDGLVPHHTVFPDEARTTRALHDSTHLEERSLRTRRGDSAQDLKLSHISQRPSG